MMNTFVMEEVFRKVSFPNLFRSKWIFICLGLHDRTTLAQNSSPS